MYSVLFCDADMTNWETRTGVIVLSYSRYCRYRGLLKRLEGVHNEWLRNKLIKALGGFTTTCRTTKILFCKDTFDYPELEGHELLCNHLGNVSYPVLYYLCLIYWKRKLDACSLASASIHMRRCDVAYNSSLFSENNFSSERN